MTNQDLRKLLEQLHDQIEQTDTVDDKGVELLSDVQAEIRRLLERSEEVDEQPGSPTIERLQDAIAHLEVSHPALTQALSNALTILSNAGI